MAPDRLICSECLAVQAHVSDDAIIRGLVAVANAGKPVVRARVS